MFRGYRIANEWDSVDPPIHNIAEVTAAVAV
jgi:hypothetical protein